MQQGINVVGNFAGLKDEIRNYDGKQSRSVKAAVFIPVIDGYQGETDKFELSIPKSEQEGDVHKSLKSIEVGSPVQIFFRKEVYKIEGRTITSYHPTAVKVPAKN
ncbi:MAG: hypothetical protein CMP91_13165 [Gammaproteobacteria bacterium]|nr:hypothetical protein [Gammaproteobacteria bacterium]|tara:strand:- start:12039 stop:12353 length:315 start_codon:yes stop_codon:yes gene_type:complete